MKEFLAVSKRIIFQEYKMCVEDIIKSHPQILEGSEIVGMYEFTIPDILLNLKVRVYKHWNGVFTGVANLEVQKDSITHKRRIRPQPTKEKALRDAVDGFMEFVSENAKINIIEKYF